MIKVCLLLIVLVILGAALLDCGNKAVQMNNAKLAKVEALV
jgi:hypothetical protein